MRKYIVPTLAALLVAFAAVRAHAIWSNGGGGPGGSGGSGSSNVTVATPSPVAGQFWTGPPSGMVGVTIGGDSSCSVAGNTASCLNTGINGYSFTNATPVSGCYVQGTGTAYACLATATPVPANQFNFPNYSCGASTNVTLSSGKVELVSVYLNNSLSFSHVGFAITTVDASNNYSWGLYNTSGVLIANTSPSPMPTVTWVYLPLAQGTVTVQPGEYFLAFGGQAITATRLACNPANAPLLAYYNNSTNNIATAGALPTQIQTPVNAPQAGIRIPWYSLMP